MSKTSKKKVADSQHASDFHPHSDVSDNNKKVLVYMVAGEASGDQIGASLMAELSQDKNQNLHFEGIGGAQMEAQGLRSLFPISELSIMGLVEIIPHALNILTRLNQTVDDIKKVKPDVVVTIDSPGFTFRLAKRVHKLNIPVIHVNAPTVWAWKPRRAEKIAGYISHLLTLFPFEPPYFIKHGLPTTFMGHPLSEKKLPDIDVNLFRKENNIAKEAPLLCVLPGSRSSEIKTHLPIFTDTIELLKAQFSNLEIVIPTLESHRHQIDDFLKQKGISAIIVTDETKKYQAMRSSTAALAASGTVTLELGLTRTPMVVAYKGNPVTAAIVRRMLLIKHVSLVNILLEKEVVPELLQEDCRAENLSLKLHKLLKTGSECRETQIESLEKLAECIAAPDQKRSSQIAADVILHSLTKA